MNYQVKKLEKKKNKYYVSIEVDAQLAEHEVSEELILDYRLVSGKILDEEQYKSLIESIHHDRFRQKLMHYCSFKPRTNAEAYQYLYQFDMPEKAKANYILKLQNMHILDDEAYVKNYIEEYAHFRMMGPVKIAFDLGQKGVDSDLIKKYIDGYSESLMKDNIIKWIDKKIKSSKNKPLKKLRESLVAFIVNKGYDYTLVQSVIDSQMSAIEDNNDEDIALQKDFDDYVRKYRKSNHSQSLKQYCIPKLMQKGYAYHKIINLIEGEEANEYE